jgi:hypothetical protein
MEEWGKVPEPGILPGYFGNHIPDTNIRDRQVICSFPVATAFFQIFSYRRHKY